jgi:PilZ domain
MAVDDDESGADKRRFRRLPVLFSGTVHQDAASFDCVIKDISAGGAQLITERPLARDRDFILDIDRAGLFTSRMVWREENRIGMMFLHEPNSVAQRIGAAWGLSE